MEDMNTENNSLFKNIDNFLFEQVSNFKKSLYVEKMSETVRSFPEEKQILLNQLSNIALLILPFLLLLGFFFFSMIKSSELSDQREIHNVMNLVKTNQGKLSKLTNSLVTRTVIEDKRFFVDDLNKVLERRDFPIKKISVDNYDDGQRGATIKIIRAEVKFKSIANNSLKTLLSQLQVKYKAKVLDLAINKDIKESRLSGSVNIEFLSKAF